MGESDLTGGRGPIVAGDGVGVKDDNPFHITYSGQFAPWMAHNGISLAFTTYTAGKTVLIGPGLDGNIAVSERNFGRAMALRATGSGLYLSTEHQVWRFENGLEPGCRLGNWDSIYMPRRSDVTGGVDIHDVQVDRDGRLLVAVTLYNCLAELDGRGSFSPLWRPAFISEITNEDRCHFNGFCLENGEPAYASVVAASNVADGWRTRRADGGMVIDMRDDSVVASGLSMPHTPRMHQGELYVLEAGSGWFGRIDRQARRFERLKWLPGFLRGLCFHGDYAVIGLSKPRNHIFSGLPLDGELARRGREPECAVYVMRLSDGEICHTLTITGGVEEIYDTAVLAGTRQPLLVGLEGEEISRFIAVGPDRSGERPRLAAE
ncbi:TIGR03032 family protein [Youhaiella tibetensis]|uniref:TIGR03032 family protein n=1 Tax=Paradevosia tibetensis TaxID=1447062 RepID=A0A5B9DPK5_9HYPH|nr:TIGR03032 family protein [Youhaiella tibetensis]QEE20865.1 TIGR03032 family protein [Youhaiella tibetensis]GGF20336.1 TIGR03032 family protein [Youhaiella tibetensis]